MDTPPEFDDDSYDVACDQGLRLSGETRDYFARERIRHTVANISSDNVERILDFGCGLGSTVPVLRSEYPSASVIGVDSSRRAIEFARSRYANQQIEFRCMPVDFPEIEADLVYCNGVFHHIEPSMRMEMARKLFEALRPGGWFSFWENNPWNPGTRLIMKRISFDRDAITLSFLESERLLRSVGFDQIRTQFYFFFPSFLRRLRKLEPMLERFPLGAQYCVFARRPGRGQFPVCRNSATGEDDCLAREGRDDG